MCDQDKEKSKQDFGFLFVLTPVLCLWNDMNPVMESFDLRSRYLSNGIRLDALSSFSENDLRRLLCASAAALCPERSFVIES